MQLFSDAKSGCFSRPILSKCCVWIFASTATAAGRAFPHCHVWTWYLPTVVPSDLHAQLLRLSKRRPLLHPSCERLGLSFLWSVQVTRVRRWEPGHGVCLPLQTACSYPPYSSTHLQRHFMAQILATVTQSGALSWKTSLIHSYIHLSYVMFA